jgi:hypothetical protein
MLHAAAASAKKIKLTVIDPARQQANLKHRLGAMAVRDINLACSRTASYFLTINDAAFSSRLPPGALTRTWR